MTRHRVPLLTALVCAVLMTSGCLGSPAPDPSTSAPLFANEDEAFAAAEATYRAYVDAGNAARTDSSHTPTPDEFLIGAALSDYLRTTEQISESGLDVTGEILVADFAPTAFRDRTVEADVCLDVSGTAVADADGHDLTPTNRAERQPLHVVFKQVDGGLLISESLTGEAPSC